MHLYIELQSGHNIKSFFDENLQEDNISFQFASEGKPQDVLISEQRDEQFCEQERSREIYYFYQAVIEPVSSALQVDQLKEKTKDKYCNGKGQQNEDHITGLTQGEFPGMQDENCTENDRVQQ